MAPLLQPGLASQDAPCLGQGDTSLCHGICFSSLAERTALFLQSVSFPKEKLLLLILDPRSLLFPVPLLLPAWG